MGACGIDFPLGRKSVLVRNVEVLERFDLRAGAAGRVAEPGGEPVAAGPAPVEGLGAPERRAGTAVASELDTNSALDDMTASRI